MLFWIFVVVHIHSHFQIFTFNHLFLLSLDLSPSSMFSEFCFDSLPILFLDVFMTSFQIFVIACFLSLLTIFILASYLSRFLFSGSYFDRLLLLAAARNSSGCFFYVILNFCYYPHSVRFQILVFTQTLL
jgi:hypothetical protein